MHEARNRHATGYVLLAAVVLAYFARPWSCDVVLSRFSPTDDVPYAYFDYHGFGVLIAWMSTVIFLAPTLWLASKILLHPKATVGLFARARDTKATILSVLIASGLGLPLYSQLGYLMNLPIGLTTPVWVSSLAWLLVVELARSTAIRGNILDRTAVRIAGAFALLVALSKLGLIGLALL